MVIHKLLARYFKHRDDEVFYLMQAHDAIGWLERVGVPMGAGTHALDLGCGHGVFGEELAKKGCKITYADQENYLIPSLRGAPFVEVNLDKDDLGKVGQHDLVICSNVFEHLAKPERFIAECGKMLKPGGRLYLSWTNWLSPFGGHDFALFHYFGPRFGRWLKYKMTGKWSDHVPFENLFLTYIGRTLRMIRRTGVLHIERRAARYYPEFSFVLYLPILREFLAWNCALLITKNESPRRLEPGVG
jgi:SAM-dependent methyltransferase